MYFTIFELNFNFTHIYFCTDFVSFFSILQINLYWNWYFLIFKLSLLFADLNSRFSEIYQLDVEYQIISNNLLASAFTYHELEKVASTFDLDVGGLLLLEATNLNDAVLVGSKRTLYFSTETSKFIIEV